MGSIKHGLKLCFGVLIRRARHKALERVKGSFRSLCNQLVQDLSLHFFRKVFHFEYVMPIRGLAIVADKDLDHVIPELFNCASKLSGRERRQRSRSRHGNGAGQGQAMKARAKGTVRTVT